MHDILANIDPQTLIIVGGVLVALVILMLLLKAIKLAVTVAIVAAVIFFVAPQASQFQDKYNITYEEGIVSVSIDGTVHEINTEDLKSVKVEEREGETYVVYQKDGEEKTAKIPGFMTSMVEKKIEEMQGENPES